MMAALRNMGSWLGGTALVMVFLSVPAGYLVAQGIRYRVDSILKSVTDVLIVVDVHGRVMLLSQVAESVLKISMAKARMHPLGEVLHDPVLRRKLALSPE